MFRIYPVKLDVKKIGQKIGQNASLWIDVGGCRPQGLLRGCGGHSSRHRVEKRWFEALTSRRLGRASSWLLVKWNRLSICQVSLLHSSPNPTTNFECNFYDFQELFHQSGCLSRSAHTSNQYEFNIFFVNLLFEYFGQVKIFFDMICYMHWRFLCILILIVNFYLVKILKK